MKKLILYFALAYFFSWIIWLPLILNKYEIVQLPVLPKYHHYLGSFGPLIAAFIVQYISEGWKGVKNLFNRILLWKVNWIWYVVVFIVPIVIVILSGFADQLINQQNFTMQGFSTNNEFPQFGAVGYFFFNFLSFGIGEETGWRGYALPVLQKKYSALFSTLILSVGWACWHIPAFLYRPLYSQMDVAGIFGFFISMFMGAIILTWLFNSTRGSLLFVSIFHAMIELMFMSENITVKMTNYIGAIMIVAAVLIVLNAKPKNLSFIQRQIL